MRILFKSMVMSLALVLAITASAQPDRGKSPRKINPELRSYLKENVLPVVKEQRLKLDQVMSSSDKATLDQIRSELETLRESGKTKFREMKENRSEQTPPTPEERAQFRAQRDARIALMDKASDLAFKYHNDIKSLMEEIRSQREEWKGELQEMRPEGRQKEGRPGERKQRFGNRKSRHPFMRMMEPVGFMLWDPNKEPAFPEKEVRARISPNPGDGVAQVDYQLQEAGQINIVLLDNQGNQLKTLTDELQEAGAHQVKVDTETLTKGIYFVKITTPKGSRTLRVMVE